MAIFVQQDHHVWTHWCIAKIHRELDCNCQPDKVPGRSYHNRIGVGCHNESKFSYETFRYPVATFIENLRTYRSCPGVCRVHWQICDCQFLIQRSRGGDDMLEVFMLSGSNSWAGTKKTYTQVENGHVHFLKNTRTLIVDFIIGKCWMLTMHSYPWLWTMATTWWKKLKLFSKFFTPYHLLFPNWRVSPLRLLPRLCGR